MGFNSKSSIKQYSLDKYKIKKLYLLFPSMAQIAENFSWGRQVHYLESKYRKL